MIVHVSSGWPWHYLRMEVDPPWRGVFEVLGADGTPEPDQGIPLTQINETSFQIDATLRYLGPTGLDGHLDDVAAVLPLDPQRTSDLASVPAITRWFVRPHGVHTPAALFHDYFISHPELMGPVDADRLFLSMLRALRVPPVKRSIMWAAVALRTRWELNKLAVVLWIALSVTGCVLFALTGLGVDVAGLASLRWPIFVATILAPIPASLLWGTSAERRSSPLLLPSGFCRRARLRFLRLASIRFLSGSPAVARPQGLRRLVDS